MISSLRGWYLETVVSICPVFAYCDDDQLAGLTDCWVTFKPGQVLAEQDQQGGLHAIITGVAQVTLNRGDETIPLGRLSTGDMVGEMNPSPVTVTAECTVLAIAIYCDLMHKLPEMAQAEIKARFARCREALQEAHSQGLAHGGSLRKPGGRVPGQGGHSGHALDLALLAAGPGHGLRHHDHPDLLD